MRVLMATNGSLQSKVALQVGAQIAQRAGEVLTVLTIVKREADCAQANEALTHARESLAPEISEIRGVIRMGHPAEEIIHEAEAGRYTLIVVGEEPAHAHWRQYRRHRPRRRRADCGSSARCARGGR